MQLTQEHLAGIAKACVDRLRSPEPFHEWLEMSPPGEVGKSGAPCNCPLARFILETGMFPFLLANVPGIRITVSATALVIYTPELQQSHALPPWALEFVRMVDNEGPRSTAISKAFALKVWAHSVGVTSH